MDWIKAQEWEKWWWGTCINSLFEEEKQIIYAKKMGLDLVGNEKTPYVFDLHGASILDIGGGATSLLLKCVNFTGEVLDPLPMPEWVKERYHEAGIDLIQEKAEAILNEVTFCDKEASYDEVWIYNVLQHTESPKMVIDNAKQLGKIIRIFEWLNTPISDGHLHTITKEQLNEWLGGEGKVEVMNTRPTIGIAYYGIFKTR